MFIIITVSSLALAFLIYKVISNNNQSLDTKLFNYDIQRDDIINDITYHKNQIESLEKIKSKLNDKIIVLLTKKIINFHKEHQHFNNNAIKKIKYLISTYANGNEYIENTVYENIDVYIDVEQIKNCDITNYNSLDQNLNNNEKNINSEYTTSSDDDEYTNESDNSNNDSNNESDNSNNDSNNDSNDDIEESLVELID